MDDPIDAVECAVDEFGVADVSFDERDTLGKRRCVVAVHLVLEAVEHDDLVSACKEPLDEVGADEPGTPRYQCAH